MVLELDELGFPGVGGDNHWYETRDVLTDVDKLAGLTGEQKALVMGGNTSGNTGGITAKLMKVGA
jgi:hypothetical protein